MRSFVVIGALAGSCLCAAPVSAATYIVWQGQSVVTSATLPCYGSGAGRSEIRIGSTVETIIRPRLLASNGNDSRIAFIDRTQAEFALVLAGGLTISGPGTFVAYGTTYGGAFRANIGGDYRDFAFVPAAPTITTPFVSLTGAIDNFMFVTGCTITFRGVYTLRP